jgi:Flp pilus assembly protein TadG
MRGFRSDRGGAAAVEFALVLPLFLMLVLGAIDFGKLFLTRNALNSAVQQAGRYAMINPRTLNCNTQIQNAAVTIARGLSLPSPTATAVTSQSTIGTGGNAASVWVTDITVTLAVPMTGFVLSPTVSVSQTYRAPRPEPPPVNPPSTCFPFP